MIQVLLANEKSGRAAFKEDINRNEFFMVLIIQSLMRMIYVHLISLFFVQGTRNYL